MISKSIEFVFSGRSRFELALCDMMNSPSMEAIGFRTTVAGNSEICGVTEYVFQISVTFPGSNSAFLGYDLRW
jgi:hypothetical protein